MPIKRWRRAVPIAAGIAASAAAVAGITQFVPQAAVSGRNAALSADVPTSLMPQRATAPTTGVTGAAGQPGATVAPTVTSALASTSTTDAPGPAGGVACVVPKVTAAVASVDLVLLPLAGKNGQTIWAAVVKGTATLTDADAPILLPALNVVAQLADGETDAVPATVAAPMLQPGKAAPFSAVVALGAAKPTTPVTATASAVGMPSC